MTPDYDYRRSAQRRRCVAVHIIDLESAVILPVCPPDYISTLKYNPNETYRPLV